MIRFDLCRQQLVLQVLPFHPLQVGPVGSRHVDELGLDP
jgi:hypothetical protein